MDINELLVRAAFYTINMDRKTLQDQTNDVLIMVTLISKGGATSSSVSTMLCKGDRDHFQNEMRLQDLISRALTLTASIVIRLPTKESTLIQKDGASKIWMHSSGAAIAVTAITNKNDAEWICHSLKNAIDW